GDYIKIELALRGCPPCCRPFESVIWPAPRAAMSPRQAVFAPSEVVPIAAAEGRVCAAPTVSCPPAVPIAVSGEVITKDAVALLERYGVGHIRVVR
ncbi:MAG: amino acid decarboxylase, partial [Clostridia bacterium]|nr:amino acid decarboxylase [Clostridia bacterium]